MRLSRDSRPEEGSDRGRRAVTFSTRIYGALTRAYPEDLRGEYGGEMVRSFRDLCRREARGRGTWGLVLLWVRVLPELAFTAFKERSIMLARNAYLPARPAVVTRWGALSALMGGASGVSAYYIGTSVSLRVSFPMLLVCGLFSALGLLGLYGALVASSGCPGRLAKVGALLAVVSAVSWLAAGAFLTSNVVWGWAVGSIHVASAVAFCCWFVGLLLLGVAALGVRLPGRLRVLPLMVAALVPTSVFLPALVPIGTPLVKISPLLGAAILGWSLLGSVEAQRLAVPGDNAPGIGTSAHREARMVSPKASRERGVRPDTIAAGATKEKELLEALRRCGALTVAGAALETSLSVDEADRMLSALATKGHLDVRVERGRLLYSLHAGDE